MRIVETVPPTCAPRRGVRTRAERIGLGPTIDDLHQGHLRLIDTAHHHGARAVGGQRFRHPAAVPPAGRLCRLPAHAEEDRALAGRGVALVFATGGRGDVSRRSGRERPRRGARPVDHSLPAVPRPGHFVGVATVVDQLLDVDQPDLAVFSRRTTSRSSSSGRMAADLSLPVRDRRLGRRCRKTTSSRSAREPLLRRRTPRAPKLHLRCAAAPPQSNPARSPSPRSRNGAWRGSRRPGSGRSISPCTMP